MTEGNRLVTPDSLRSYCQRLFETQAMPPEEALIAADSLVEANLNGVDSHGVSRMPIYIKRLREKIVSPTCTVKVINETPGALVLDGCNSMGAVTGVRAMEMGTAKAKTSGAVFITVNHSNHFGTAAYFTKMAARQDMIGFAGSNAPSTMAPWGGAKPYFGTNPFAVSIPVGAGNPITMDMATSVVAQGKIILAQKDGKQIPLGWAIDKDGNQTTDPQAALAGSVLPFGGPKGYAIALLIDVLAGILSGASFGPYLNSMWTNFSQPQNVGHYFMVLDISKFIDIGIFKASIDRMVGDLKQAPPAKGVDEILLPGEIEQRKKAQRTQAGIPLSAAVLKDLQELGDQHGVVDTLAYL